MNRYTQSAEEYKGFILQVVMTQDPVHPSLYHRRCHVIDADGSRVAYCKTKKEAKDLIGHSAFRQHSKGINNEH